MRCLLTDLHRCVLLDHCLGHLRHRRPFSGAFAETLKHGPIGHKPLTSNGYCCKLIMPTLKYTSYTSIAAGMLQAVGDAWSAVPARGAARLAALRVVLAVDPCPQKC